MLDWLQEHPKIRRRILALCALFALAWASEAAFQTSAFWIIMLVVWIVAEIAWVWTDSITPPEDR